MAGYREVSPHELGASLPKVEFGGGVPSVSFNQYHGIDLLRRQFPRSCFIGDAVALANCCRRDDIVEHLKGPARRFIQTVQAQALPGKIFGNQASKTFPVLQCYLTILALGIGTPIYVINRRGGAVTAQLEDAYIQNHSVMLQIRTDGQQVAKSVKLTDFENLRLEGGCSVLFKLQFVKEVPDQWVWNWSRLGKSWLSGLDSQLEWPESGDCWRNMYQCPVVISEKVGIGSDNDVKGSRSRDR
jgi:hypothetical protein